MKSFIYYLFLFYCFPVIPSDCLSVFSCAVQKALLACHLPSARFHLNNALVNEWLTGQWLIAGQNCFNLSAPLPNTNYHQTLRLSCLIRVILWWLTVEEESKKGSVEPCWQTVQSTDSGPGPKPSVLGETCMWCLNNPTCQTSVLFQRGQQNACAGHIMWMCKTWFYLLRIFCFGFDWFFFLKCVNYVKIVIFFLFLSSFPNLFNST